MVSTELVTGKVWPAIQAAAEKARGRKYAAVAYIGADGAELLSDFGENDVLVCNMGTAALRTGATNPEAIEKLLARGVYVYSYDLLHAKVYVLGSVAFVGSANVSDNSASRLAEAAVKTAEQSVVKDARGFIVSLCSRSSLVDENYLEFAKTLYRAPRISSGADLRGETVVRSSPRVVIITTTWQNPPKSIREHYATARHRVQRKAGPTARWSVDVLWDDDPDWIQEGDWLMLVDSETDETSPPMRVISRPSLDDRPSRIVTWYRVPNQHPCLPWDRVVAHVRASTRHKLSVGSVVKSRKVVDAMFALWDLSLDE